MFNGCHSRPLSHAGTSPSSFSLAPKPASRCQHHPALPSPSWQLPSYSRASSSQIKFFHQHGLSSAPHFPGSLKDPAQMAPSPGSLPCLTQQPLGPTAVQVLFCLVPQLCLPPALCHELSEGKAGPQQPLCLTCGRLLAPSLTRSFLLSFNKLFGTQF